VSIKTLRSLLNTEVFVVKLILFQIILKNMFQFLLSKMKYKNTYIYIHNYIVRPRYACVYCANLSYFRARDLRRHLLRIHGEVCDTLVQGSSFPAINSVLRNATAEEMIKYLGFTNQTLLTVTPDASNSGERPFVC